MERIDKDRMTKRVYVGVYADSCSVGRWGKRWIDTVKDCLRKRGFGSQASKERVGVGKGG